MGRLASALTILLVFNGVVAAQNFRVFDRNPAEEIASSLNRISGAVGRLNDETAKTNAINTNMTLTEIRFDLQRISRVVENPAYLYATPASIVFAALNIGVAIRATTKKPDTP